MVQSNNTNDWSKSNNFVVVTSIQFFVRVHREIRLFDLSKNIFLILKNEKYSHN